MLKWNWMYLLEQTALKALTAVSGCSFDIDSICRLSPSLTESDLKWVAD